MHNKNNHSSKSEVLGFKIGILTMFFRYVVTIAVILTTLSVASYSQEFYDIDSVNAIEITFAEPNWDEILDSLYAAGYEDRLIATVVINGVTYDSVGVRYKGYSSYDPSLTKNPFNIKLDHIVDGQEIDGYGTLKLANVFLDPSFVREVLGYEIARKYTPASRANFINVSVNGELIGLYTNVQSVDKSFLRSHYFSDENAFFKADPQGAPGPSNHGASLEYWGPDSTSYYEFYEMKSDSGWLALVGLCDTLNNYPSEVERILNVDRLLWFIAFHNLLVSLDSPIYTGRNFYLYKDGTNRFNHIIWDLNMTFGTFSMSLIDPSQPPLTLTDLQELDPFYNIDNPAFPVISKILQIPEYRKTYIAHIRTILAENFTNGWYETRALEIQSIIDTYVQADPNMFFNYTSFLNNVSATVGFGPLAIVGITELMNGRISFLNNHQEFQYTVPVISSVSNTPTIVELGSEVWLNATVESASSILLGYRTSSSDQFNTIQMLDDGNHNDGAAADGVYGVSLQVGTTDIQYYFRAENADAAAFLPERAEYEYYSISVIGSVVINEFMASNGSTIADQDGEYDDWIELYNNSDSSISLNGYYLSDDGLEPAMWAFPDTIIAGNDYLIIWADKDTLQLGLHANFKLSSSGESIIMSDSVLNVISEVTFGSQVTDISTGRYPNGIGDFREMAPTFAAENVDWITGFTDVTTVLPTQFSLSQNYPNPFNPNTTIAFSLSRRSYVTLDVFNLLGQWVCNLVSEELPAGEFEYSLKAEDLSSGLYFYRLETDSFKETRKMILLK